MPRICCMLADILLLCIASSLFAQNLVPNPDFETFTLCPVNINMGEPLPCQPWLVPTGGTSDYFNACHTGGIVGVPNNIFGVMPAHSGVAYTGVLLYYSTWLDYREFLQVQLDQPMIAGYPYVISFWYTLSSNSCPIDRLGVHLGDTQITDPITYGPLQVTPQLDLNSGLIGISEWQYFRECYIATGGEEWLTIGNFHPDSEISLGSGCGSGLVYSYLYIDDVAVEQGTPPDAIVLGGPVITLCPGESIMYDFDPMYGDYLWQDGSTSPVYTITAPGIYALTLTAECITLMDEVEIVAIEPPVFDLGPDITICAWDILLLNFDPMLGNFLWQDGSGEASYTITEPGIYSLTVTNACGEASDVINVEHYPDPFVTFPDDTLSACVGESLTFSFDPGIGEYLWQDGSSGDTYTVTESGIYAVTVVNPCGSDFSVVVVDFIGEPELNLGPDLTLCPAQLPYVINLSGLESADTYLWTDGSSAPTFAIQSAGTYAVTVSNACFSVSDTLTVTVGNTPPSLDLGGDTTLCPGDTLLLYLSGNTPGTYTWQDGDSATTYAVTGSGLYSLTVTNACGTDSDSVQVQFMDTLPTPDLGPNISLCPGETTVLHAGIAGVGYLWQDGSVADSIIVDTADTIVLTVSNSCAITSDTLVVSFDAMGPVLDLPPLLSLCVGDSVIIESGLTGVTYLWNTGDTLSSIIATAPGTFILTVTNACGTHTDTTTVTDLGGAPVLDLGADFSLCPGDSLVLDPGIPAVTYLWHNGDTTPAFMVTGPGTISLVVSNICGAAFDTVIVAEDSQPPMLDLGPDVTLCAGEVLLLDPALLGVSYLWQDGSTSDTFLVTDEMLVVLEVSNACGTGSDSMFIHVVGQLPTVDLGPDTVLCDGALLTLAPDLSDVLVLWQNGSTDSTLVVSMPGWYAVTVSNTCEENTDSIRVQTSMTPMAFNLGPDRIICPSETLILEAPPTDTGNILAWNTGVSTSELEIHAAGQYTLTISNICGSIDDTVLVSIDTHQLIGPVESLFSVCNGDVLTLDIDQGIPANYLWDDGSSAPRLLVTEPGTYVATVNIACDTLVQVFLVETVSCDDQKIFIPNVFSPNGDGVNDAFGITTDYSNLLDFRIRIYDRWGGIVYYSTDPDFQWYGDSRGRPLNPGVYVYHMVFIPEGENATGAMSRYGDITLVR